MPRELYKDYFPEFALIGGLVFVIAGLPLLEQCLHSRGMHELIGSLTELIGSKESDLKKSGEEGDDDDDEDDDKEEDGEGGDRAQALLCSSCLAHDVNEGFRDFVGCRLLRINGKRVKNLAHLVELMAPYMAGLVEGQGKEASSTATSKEPAPTTPPNQEDARRRLQKIGSCSTFTATRRAPSSRRRRCAPRRQRSCSSIRSHRGRRCRRRRVETWDSRVRVIQCGMRVVIRNRERSRPIAYVTHARDHAGASLSSPLVRFPSLPAARRGPTLRVRLGPRPPRSARHPPPPLPLLCPFLHGATSRIFRPPH